MSNDFDDGSDDPFFSTGDEVPKEDRPLGLIVGPTARQIFDPITGALIWDELPEIEADFRRLGRPPVVFVEDDSPGSFGNDVSG